MNRNLVKSVGLRINPILYEKIEKDALEDDVPYSMIVQNPEQTLWHQGDGWKHDRCSTHPYAG